MRLTLNIDNVSNTAYNQIVHSHQSACTIATGKTNFTVASDVGKIALLTGGMLGVMGVWAVLKLGSLDGVVMPGVSSYSRLSLGMSCCSRVAVPPLDEDDLGFFFLAALPDASPEWCFLRPLRCRPVQPKNVYVNLRPVS
ncbi:hypothetical protein V5799_000562 [Amblyomma americanum]|uniref:Uncharacterized protein n=1 Tax=Amblyomma americanum TaxID=6943 RepID=A0AAQ4D2P5_AMBAM